MLTGTERHDRHRAGGRARRARRRARRQRRTPTGWCSPARRLATGLPALLGLLAEVLTAARYPAGEVSGERGPVGRADRHVPVAGRRRWPARRWPAGWRPVTRTATTLPYEEQVEATTPAQLRPCTPAWSGRPARAGAGRRPVSPARALDSGRGALAELDRQRRRRASRCRCPRCVTAADADRGPARFGADLVPVRRCGAAPRRPALPGAAAGEPGLRRLLLLPLGGEHP